MILILSLLDDLHATAVAWGARRLGVQCSILDMASIPSSEFVGLKLDNAGDVKVSMRGHEISEDMSFDSSSVSVIWNRRLNFSLFDTRGVHELDRHQVVVECRATVSNFHAALCASGVKFVNDHMAGLAAENKLYQLMVARSSGLRIPRTIVGNDPDMVEEFYESSGGKTLMKPFYQPGWMEVGKEFIQHANILDDRLVAMKNSIRLCPAIYQDYIDKAFELRAVVMGRDILFVKIDSQARRESSIDWRGDLLGKSKLSLFYDVPVSVRNALLDFMRRMKLDFGCIDLIVTEQGDYFFLEVNDQGQFLWIEERNPEIRILDMFCRYLASIRTPVSGALPVLALKDYLGSEQFAVDKESAQKRWEFSIGSAFRQSSNDSVKTGSG